ncbi:hypothetical protein ElP_13180 [Tautonia plasticadhaerens]|uniref:Tc1-like transposase DDE domain-containing protein n=1 Tax=Tautonia plasticadhaerens TaxID=2527974 RepID=A0A518GXW7_9BACT|nr:hypothetical protein ElP_13180 [Tautonia plasticadhaerens]
MGVPCGRMAIYRKLRERKVSREEKSLHATERDSRRVRRKRRAFRKVMAGLDPRRLVFIDGAGAHTAMTRTYVRAPRGQRVRGSVPGHWESVTLIAGSRRSGVVAPPAFEGAMDATTFAGYVRKALASRLGAGDVVAWGNLKPHESAGARRASEGVGAHLLPLPPYSPDDSPIEEMDSKVKGKLRSAEARTTDAACEAMGVAPRAVCPSDIRGWLKHCGLCATQS